MPNVFLDFWMSRLVPSVVVIYLFIFRRVVNTARGRRDHGYPISLADFCAAPAEEETEFLEGGAGLSRHTVQDALRKLVSVGLIGHKKGKGTNADFFTLKAIPKTPQTPTFSTGSGKPATGANSATVRPPATGANSAPESGNNCPATGANSAPVLLYGKKGKNTVERTQPASPPSVAVVVRTEPEFFSSVLPLFAPWFDGEWTPRFGSHHRADALEVWPKVVTLGNMNDLIAATRSYVASRNPESTEYDYHPHNFLTKFGKNQFRDRWKPYMRPLTNQERGRARTLAFAKHLDEMRKKDKPP